MKGIVKRGDFRPKSAHVGTEKMGSRPISRVLSGTVIPLGSGLPRCSSNLPEGSASHAIASYSALLRMGFTLPHMLPRARCALTAPFHHCRAPIVQRRITRGECKAPATCAPSAARLRTQNACEVRWEPWAVYFLWHFPSPRGARSLTGIPLSGARTFLCTRVMYSDCLVDFPHARVSRLEEGTPIYLRG
jgi:hypothetical protein